MAGIKINVDATGAKQGAQEVNAALQKMSEAAAKSVAEMDKIGGALTRQQEAQKAARAVGLEEIAVLQQKIKIQQQVQAGTLSLAQATRKMAEADIFAKTGNRELAQALAATRAEYDKNTRAIQQHGEQTQRSSAAMSTLRQIVGGLTIATAFLAAARAAKDLTQEGIRYNATLESQRIGIASIIAATQKVTTAQGQTVEGVEKFNAAQSLAVGLMKQIQKDALQTTATTEQLVTAFQSALGPLSAAGLTLDQSRQATLKIVQAASALGVPMHQVAQEVRAIAEGSIDVNARLAKALGITNEMVKAARDQGKLFEFITEKMEDFAAAGKVTEQSFSGMASSISDVSSQILGLATAPLFDAMKEGMQAVLNILLEIRKQFEKDLPSAIANMSRKLFELQQQQLDAVAARTIDTGIGEVETGGIRVSDAEIRQLNEALQKLQVEWGMQKSAAQEFSTTIDQQYTPAQIAAAEQVRKHNERLKEHGETLNLTGEALARYHQAAVLKETGDKALAETTYKLVLADEAAEAQKKATTKATQDQTEADRKAKKAKEDFDQAVIDANLRVNKMNDELFKLRKKEDEEEATRQQTMTARVAKLQQELVTIQEEGQLINASLGPKAVLRDLELSIAKARIDRQVATDLAVKSEIALTDEEKKAIVAIGNVAKANLEAAAAQQKTADAVADAALSTADLKTVTQGLLSGTQDLGDVAKDLGQTVGLRLVEGIMFGKGQNEHLIIGNFNQLLGVDAAGLFGAQGMDLGKVLVSSIGDSLLSGSNMLGSAFGTNAGDAASVSWEVASADVFSAGGASLASAQAGGLTLGTVFGAAMAGAAGLALGKGISGFLGVGGSKSGKLGGNIGGLIGGVGGGILGSAFGPIGSAIGSGLGAAVGSIFGGFIGDLFASTPTKGTEIRKGVKKFLKEIEVSFADEIDTGDYFFGATKKLANKLFGGDGGEDFLKASKVILNDKIGPEIAKQLQALGTFITADQAKKLGKSVEQTGTTFGNLLLDNLGLDPEKIQGAIDEIIEKAGISFEALTEKLTSLFNDKDISPEFYKDAIMGAVDIFFNDFPAAIQVSKIALESFTEDGIFDFEKFQKAMEHLTSVFDAVVNSFIDVVVNTEPGKDIGEAIGKQIAKGLEDVAVAAFLTKFIDEKLFEGVDITDGLNADEIAIIKQRAAEARVEVEKLWDAFGGLGKEIDDAEDKAEELWQTLRNLTQQRFELRLSVISDLASIGAITGADAARARIEANASTVERFANPNGLGARISDFVSDEELAQAIEAVRDTRQAVVDLFKAQEQAAQDALSKRIKDINEDYDARRKALQKEAQAEADASAARLDALAQEKDQVQELFQARLDGLRDELQIAQAFQQLARSLQQTINGIVSSSGRFSGPEQLALAERQAETLRKQIAGSSGEEQARLIQELSEVLTTQLGAAKDVLGEEAFRTMADSIILELEGLRDESAVKGDAVEQIQAAIAATTASMDVALKSIDESIRQEQANAQARQREIQEQTERLSQEEQAAVDAATAETVAEIAALRLAAAEEIRKLAVIEDQMLAEQIERAQEALSLTVEQVGILRNIETAIGTLNTAIVGFLNTIATTAGAEGGVATTAQTTGTSSVAVNSSVTVNVSGDTSNLDADSIARAVTQAVQYEWQNGQTGREIRQYVDRS